MNSSRTIACGALALCTLLQVEVAEAADEPKAQPLTRAQVRQEAIDARKAGQPGVGDDPYYPYGPNTTVAKPAHSKVKKAKGIDVTARDAGTVK